MSLHRVLDISVVSIDDHKSDLVLNVASADLSDWENLLKNLECGSVLALVGLDSDPSVLVWNVTLQLTVIWNCVIAHAHAASLNIVDIVPGHVKLDDFIGACDRLSFHDNLSSLLLIVSELAKELLSLGSHNLAHSSLNSTNDVVARATISIDHLELNLLLLLEEVLDCDCRSEVWVEIVVDLLSLAHLDPTSISLLVEDTARI